MNLGLFCIRSLTVRVETTHAQAFIVIIFALLCFNFEAVNAVTMNKAFTTKGQIIGWWSTPKVVLNAVDQTTSSAKKSMEFDDGSQLVNQLSKCMLSMKGNYMSSDGSIVDYETMRNSQQMDEYVALVQQLANVRLSALSPAEKKAFFINIYNSLTLHALCRSDILPAEKATSTLGRLKLYASAAYVIDGAEYSLNDIENGILRGNKASAAPFTKPPIGDSAAADPRAAHVLPCDPRIHFALNCGAMSCPPIGVYSTSDAQLLNEQLQLATKSFISSEVQCDSSGECVYMSKIFDWYAEDFIDDFDRSQASQGGAAGAALSAKSKLFRWAVGNAGQQDRRRFEDFIANCRRQEPRIKFAKYDWAMNASK